MCEFKPGDEVVCVVAHDLPALSEGFPTEGLVEGRVYTVASVGPCGLAGDDSIVVRLKETGNLDHFGRDWGYWPLRFRKVDRKSDSLSIEAFLTIKPGFEEPKRAPSKKRERVQ